MNLPANVVDLLNHAGLIPRENDRRHGPALLTKGPPLSPEASRDLVDWIFQHEKGHDALSEWLDFLRRARTDFAGIAEKMGRWNSQSSHSLGHDKWNVGWGGDSLLPHANALYALKSSGLRGRVLECGAFKGSSTACLSLICAELGFELDCADSFEGLPGEEGHYGKGDFLGTLDEVRENVTRFGKIDSVRFIEGWYAESLQDYSDPIALLWLDVDLQESTLDVLRNVFSKVPEGGVILSDGFTEGVDFDGQKIAHTGGEPAGFYRYFQEHNIPYCAAPGGSKGLAQIAALPDGTDWNFLLPRSFLSELFEKL